MAARNRGRPAGGKDDADEERNIWNQLRTEGKRTDSLVVSLAFYQFSAAWITVYVVPALNWLWTC